VFHRYFAAFIFRVEESSAKVMAIVGPSETSVLQITQRHIPKDLYFDTYPRENPKTQTRAQLMQYDMKEWTGT
jgi:hypothetical protein